MFKTTSDNTQSRERRKVLWNRTNAGIDEESTFKPKSHLGPSDKEIVMERLFEVGQELLQVNQSISNIKMSHHCGVKGQTYNTLISLSQRRSDLVAEKSAIELALRKIKVDAHILEVRKRKAAGKEKSKIKQERQLAFAEVFQRMAQELLVDDVYERIITATIHRMDQSGS